MKCSRCSKSIALKSSGNPACTTKEIAHDPRSPTRLTAYRHPGSDSESRCSAKARTHSERTRSQKAGQGSGEGGQDCVIAAFCNQVVTAEGTASRVHKPLSHGSALPFEELLIRRDFTLVGAPHLQPGRDHFVVAPLDLGSQDGGPVPAFLRGRFLDARQPARRLLHVAISAAHRLARNMRLKPSRPRPAEPARSSFAALRAAACGHREGCRSSSRGG
jgi:hypothetical protein